MLSIVILALIQGLTEFLPVSSSGHLILIPYLIGWQDQGLEMDVALHAGTLLAVVFYFWRDVKAMALSTLKWIFFRKAYDKDTSLALNLVVGTLPVVIIGFIFKQINTIRSPLVIAFAGILFGVLLYGIDLWRPKEKKIEQITLFHAVYVGVAQAIALVPGVSRAGITMTAVRSLGFDRQTAARFSFLLSIPAITGAVALTTYDIVRLGAHMNWPLLGVGVAVSMLAGLAAIHGMLKFLQRFSFLPFMIYRILLGLLAMALV